MSRRSVLSASCRLPVGLLVLGVLLAADCSRKAAVTVAPEPVPVESTACLALRRNESLQSGLNRLNLSAADAGRLQRCLGQLADTGFFRSAGAESLFCWFRDSVLYRLEYRQRYDRSLIIQFDSAGIRAAGRYHWVRVVPKVYAGSIRHSLWNSMLRSGQKPEMIMRFADLFSWDIDFFTETHNGDSFKLLTEQLYCDSWPVGREQLIVGQYKGKVGEYFGYYFEDPSGRKGYYTRDGQSVRKGFLRSPLQFSKVTSAFSTGRFHPILRIVRPHQGVDYAARTGTPVSAIGDGIVTQCGWSGGYGRLVEIRHAGGYSSRYGHLSRFGKIRVGSRVSQGQVIGYVGASGLATGPHLHFEVRVNGVPRNPLKIIPPRAPPVAREYLTMFRARADSLSALLRRTTSAAGDSTESGDSTAQDAQRANGE